MGTKNPAVVAAMEEQLGVRCDHSSWWIARELLRACWKRKPQVIRDASFDLRELPFIQAARDILWRRALTPDMIGKWVHHYDKNSQYLSAGRGVRTGCGDPVHLEEDIVPGLPGIYRVRARNVSGEFGGDLPEVIEPDQEWVTSDVAVFASEHGYELHYEEAWVFPDYCKVLDAWSEKIWKARQHFNPKLHLLTNMTLEDQQAAYVEMKEIALIGNGAWATSKEKMWDKESLDLIHPNWWADVVGKARVNLLANLLRYGSPVLIKTDGLWFIARTGDKFAAASGILDRANECGGYKYEGSFRVRPAIYREAAGLSPNELSTFFKHLAGENHSASCIWCRRGDM
jgi:hypothetical protein